MANKIILGGWGSARVEDAGKADAAITPGDLVERTATGIKRHATAGGSAMPIFALDSPDQNRGIDSDYVTGEDTPVAIAQAGLLVNALLAANADAVLVGDPLGSAGDGTLRKVTAGQATRAKVTIGTGDAAVEYEATSPGNEGNAISIQYLAATAGTATVVVTGNAIVIKPDSTTQGTTDTAATVVALVNGDAEASALVVARAPGTGASAVVSPVAATNLVGGMDAGGTPAGIVAFATEAVDNSSGGTKVRIKAEVR